MTLSPEFRLLQHELVALEAHDGLSLEGFALATRLLDGCGRLLRNLHVSVWGLTKEVKRSELRAYVEGHALACRGFLANPAADWAQQPVPIPDGLIGPYLPAAEALTGYFTQLAITDSLDRAAALLALHQKAGPDGWTRLTAETATTTTAINKLTREALQEGLRRFFEEGLTGQTKSAGEVLGGRPQLVSLHAVVLGYEQRYHTALAAARQLKGLEQQIDQLVGAIAHRKLAAPDYVEALFQFIATLAQQLDLLGVLIHEMQRIEHNYTLALAQLVEHTLQR